MAQQSTESQLPPPPDGYVTRPGVVTLICLTSLISIAFQLFSIVLYAIGQYEARNEEYYISLAVFALILGIYGAIIQGLWRAKNWARIAFVIVFPLFIILELVLEPNFINRLRLVVFVVFAVLLFRPKAAAFFRGETLAPIDPTTGLEVGDRQIIPCPACAKEVYSTAQSCHHCGADLSPHGPSPGND